MSIQHIAGPLVEHKVDAIQPIPIVDFVAVDDYDWAPVAALRSADQERLASELVDVVRLWIKGIRPGLWRNLRGELYPQQMDHLTSAGEQ